MVQRRKSRKRAERPRSNMITDYLPYMMMQNLMRGMPSADVSAQRQAATQRDLITDVREDEWRDYQKAQAALQETRVQARHKQVMTSADEDRITGIFLAGKERGAQEGWSPAREATEFAKLIAAHPESAEFLGTLNMTVGYGPTTTEQMAHFWGTGTDIDGRMADLKSSKDFIQFAVERWKTKGPEIFGAQWEDQEFQAVHDFAMDAAWWSNSALVEDFKASNPELWGRIGEDITYALDFVGGITNDFNWSQQQKQDRLAAEVTQAETVTRAQKDIEAEFDQDNVYGLMPTGEGQFEWVQGTQGPKGDVKWHFGPEDSRIPMGMNAHIKGPFGPNVFSNWQQLEGRNWGRDAESETIAALVQGGMTEGMSPEDARQFVSQFQSDPTGRWGQNIVGPGMHPGPISLPGAAAEAEVDPEQPPQDERYDFTRDPTGQEDRPMPELYDDLLKLSEGRFQGQQPVGDQFTREISAGAAIDQALGLTEGQSFAEQVILHLSGEDPFTPEEQQVHREIYNDIIHAHLPPDDPFRLRYSVAGPLINKLSPIDDPSAEAIRTPGVGATGLPRTEPYPGVDRALPEGSVLGHIPRTEDPASRPMPEFAARPFGEPAPPPPQERGGIGSGYQRSLADPNIQSPLAAAMSQGLAKQRETERDYFWKPTTPVGREVQGGRAAREGLDILRQLPAGEINKWIGGQEDVTNLADQLRPALPKQEPTMIGKGAFAPDPNKFNLGQPPSPPTQAMPPLTRGIQVPSSPPPPQTPPKSVPPPYNWEPEGGRFVHWDRISMLPKRFLPKGAIPDPDVAGDEIFLGAGGGAHSFLHQTPSRPQPFQGSEASRSIPDLLSPSYVPTSPPRAPSLTRPFDINQQQATPPSQQVPNIQGGYRPRPAPRPFDLRNQPGIDPSTQVPHIQGGMGIGRGGLAPPPIPAAIPDIVGDAQRGAVKKIFPGMEGGEEDAIFNLVRAIGETETGGHPTPRTAKGDAGESGRYQFMPGTARDMGRDPANAQNWTESQQAEMVAGHLLELLNRYGSEYNINDLAGMLSGYNQGATAHRRGGTAADPYIAKVRTNLGPESEYEALINQYIARLFGGLGTNN